MQNYPCGLCGGLNFIHVLRKTDKYKQTVCLALCEDCGLQQLNPRMNDSELEQFYASDYYRLYSMDDKKAAKPHWVKRKETIARGILDAIEVHQTLSNKRLLDCGCGHGYLIKQARDRGARVFGIEPSLKHAQELKRAGFDVFAGGLQAYTADCCKSFDIITLSHVLEHISRPCDFLAVVIKLMRPEGILCVEVPNTPWFTAYGRHPLSIHSAHIYYFSERTLCATFESSGLEVISVSYGFDGQNIRGIGKPCLPKHFRHLSSDNPEKVLIQLESSLRRLNPPLYLKVLQRIVQGFRQTLEKSMVNPERKDNLVR